MPSAPNRGDRPSGLGADELTALFAGFTPFSNLAFAVSGGADSLALMELFALWRSGNSWDGKILVLTVDHGLRAESRSEAEFVARRCAELGFSHQILEWTDDRSASNLQAAARAARYRLMADAMRFAGCEALVLAHHRDDQVETFLDRLTRGSGVYGLSGMAVDEVDGVYGLRLLRPLLGVPKARLVASLSERGLRWCEDPSNDDDKYKRNRLRQIARSLAEEGLEPERVLSTIGRFRRVSQALEVWLEQIYRQHVIEHPAGPLRLDQAAYRDLPEEIRLKLLSSLIQRATGGSYPPRLAKVEDLDADLGKGVESLRTLGGASIRADGTALWLWREVGRKPPATLCGPGRFGTWDQRFRYTVSDRSDLVLGPLCDLPAGHGGLDYPDSWPKAAFATAPAVWTEAGQVIWLPAGCRCRDGLNSDPGVDILRLKRRPFLRGNGEVSVDMSE